VQSRLDTLQNELVAHGHNIRALQEADRHYRSRWASVSADEHSRIYVQLAHITEQLEARKTLRQQARRECRRLERDRNQLIKRLQGMLGRAVTGDTRQKGSGIKKKLDKSHDCPYCGRPLGEQPHADHIYPVALGGRSEVWNMVYVCADCNSMKSSMTLMGFIIRRGRNVEDIHRRLAALNKNF
jgi:5-methylcytosine-specific restriction endonuclease McrA